MSGRGEVVANEAQGPGWQLAIFAVIIVSVAFAMPNFGFMPLASPIQKAFHMSFSAMGLFTGMSGLGGIVAAIPAGILLKRYGEKPIIIGGMLIMAAGFAILALAPNLGWLFVGRAIWVLAFHGMIVLGAAALVLNSPGQFQALYQSLNQSAGGVATAVAATLTGVIAAGFGWRGAFWGYIIILLIALAIFIPTYRSSKGKDVPQAADPAAPKLRSPWRTPIVWLFALLLFLAAVPPTAMLFMGPPVLAVLYKLSPPQVGHLISLGFLLGIPVTFVVGWIADRTNRKLIMSAVLALFIVLEVLIVGHGRGFAQADLVIAIAFASCILALGFAISGQALQGREIGPVMGVAIFGLGVGTYVGPQMVGVLKDLAGSFAAGYSLAALFAALAIVELILLEVFLKKPSGAGASS